MATIASCAVIVVGIWYGAPVAGGSDSYGYVSQAHLWAIGRMREELRLRELVPVVRAEALVPLGYHLAPDRASIVPTYSAGLPLVMAVFERLAGRRGVFWVIPLLAGVAVWSTYLLGRSAAGPLAGALAAVLLASSPAFLLQLVAAPMSEVAVTAWWALALAMLYSGRSWAPAASGAAAGLAILTRPNLAPLALVLGTGLLWPALAAAPLRRRQLLFAAPVLAACLAIALVYYDLRGSPLQSGFDARDTLRFLLPALPAVFVLVLFALLPSAAGSGGSDGGDDALHRSLPRRRVLAALAVTGLVAAHGITYALREPAFDTRGDHRYAIIGEQVARRLPENAVLLASQHSGSVRYYSGRPTVRYDLVSPRRLDRVVKRLRVLGYQPYFLLEDWEVPVFSDRFAGRSLLGALDWPPLLELDYALVRIWDPADADRPRNGTDRTTEIVPWPFPLD